MNTVAKRKRSLAIVWASAILVVLAAWGALRLGVRQRVQGRVAPILRAQTGQDALGSGDRELQQSTSRGSARVQRPLHMDPGSRPVVGSSLTDCLQLEYASEIQACLYATFGATASEAEAGQILATELCGTRKDGALRHDLVRIALDSYRHGSPLGVLKGLRAECPGWEIDDIIDEAVAAIAVSDPLLFLAIRDGLTPEALFDPQMGAVAVVLAAAVAARFDDGDLKAILEEGAIGRLGGTTEQVMLAINGVARLTDSGADRLELVSRVLGSPVLPLEGVKSQPFGANLMSMLASDVVTRGNAEADVAGAMLRLLDDPHFGKNAAAQMLKHMSKDAPPPEFSIETWSGLWDHATMVSQL